MVRMRDTEEVLNMKLACEILNVSWWWLDNAVKDGRISCSAQIHKMRFFYRSDVFALLKEKIYGKDGCRTDV